MNHVPQWLKKRLVLDGDYSRTREMLARSSVPTVCKSSMCPNINECFSKAQATFLMLGERCTRSCAFCAIGKGSPAAPDDDEPRRIAIAALSLGLSYAVVTSVTRDDMADGGAFQFVKVIEKIRQISQGRVGVEVLIPDFRLDRRSIELVVKAGPEVIAHNIETVRRLYPEVRSGAGYDRSVAVLRMIKNISPGQLTKSGIMVGLGETEAEVFDAMKDLKAAGCDILTIGQYLRPGKDNIEVCEFVSPDQFIRYREAGEQLGFRHVSSGPFVRSSYMAGDIYNKITGGMYDRCYASAAC